MKILHISDCHVLATPGSLLHGVDSFATLKAVLNHAMALLPEIILVSGDLSEDGTAQSYERLRALFLETGLPVYVVPGNHDDLAAMRSSLISDSIHMEPFLETEFWGFVFLNSQVVGQSYGFLEPSQLEMVSTALENPSQHVLTCLHHGPITDCPSSGCQLRNASQFLELLASSPKSKVVLSGHIHLEQHRRFHHLELFTSPSSFSNGKHPNLGDSVDIEDFWASHSLDGSRGYRIVELHPEGTVATQVHWT